VVTREKKIKTNDSHFDWKVGVALALIMIAAGALRFANLAALGYVNHYYTAAVVSMLKSWHNFFFLAAEPGGAVSVDKPPLGLWLQAASAYIFGVNTLGVLLPEILAGLVSIAVLYHLVRKSFGTLAGLIAALALAITPIVIATERNNTSDSLLILAMLLAAWAFFKAVETRKMRFLLIGAALVGIGFNIKMLEAFLPLPAFYGLYILGSSESLWRKAGKLLLASVLLLIISLSWVTVVDLTPTNQRPYIGSSGDNSEMSLITGYNGMYRLLGMFGRRNPGQAGGFSNRGSQGSGQNGGQPRNGEFPSANNGRSQGGTPNNGGLQGGSPNNGFTLQSGNSGTSNGSVDIGQSGILRLFIPPLSKNASWLLPFGLAGVLLLFARGRLRWPVVVEHQALVLWGGWLATGGIFFSIAQFFHEYYLAFLGPPLAALVGIGAAQFWELRKQHTWIASILLFVVVAGTLGFQMMTAAPYIRSTAWLPYALVLLAVGAILWMAARKPGRVLQAGFICMIASILVAPGLWSVLTNAYPSENQSLPSVYSGQTGAAADLRGLQVDQALLDYLEPRTSSDSYLLAVPSSMQGSDFVIATGRPVLYLGGFMGMDQVVTTDQLSQMVKAGKLRFIYWDAHRSGNGAQGGQSDTSSWVSSHCTAVPGFDASAHNTGAPGGIGSTTASTNRTGGFSQDFGALQISLYDCSGAK
jgi:4-amino-4-deoxy-L-arabinose transferase-like glycosyltransferase